MLQYLVSGSDGTGRPVGTDFRMLTLKLRLKLKPFEIGVQTMTLQTFIKRFQNEKLRLFYTNNRKSSHREFLIAISIFFEV